MSDVSAIAGAIVFSCGIIGCLGGLFFVRHIEPFLKHRRLLAKHQANDRSMWKTVEFFDNTPAPTYRTPAEMPKVDAAIPVTQVTDATYAPIVPIVTATYPEVADGAHLIIPAAGRPNFRIDPREWPILVDESDHSGRIVVRGITSKAASVACLVYLAPTGSTKVETEVERASSKASLFNSVACTIKLKAATLSLGMAAGMAPLAARAIAKLPPEDL